MVTAFAGLLGLMACCRACNSLQGTVLFGRPRGKFEFDQPGKDAVVDPWAHSTTGKGRKATCCNGIVKQRAVGFRRAGRGPGANQLSIKRLAVFHMLR